MIAFETLRLGFAFSAGAATFFAPCAYPLLPGYVAFYLGDADGDQTAPASLRQAVLVGGLVSLGFFVVYAALAGIVAAVGTTLLRDIAVLELFVGALLVVLGLGMLAGRLSPASLHVALPRRRRSKSEFFLFGVVYAVAAAGCTAPIFVAIASLALGGGPAAAVLTFGAYATGMALLIIGTTVLVALGRGQILRRLSGQSDRLQRAAGALLVLAGLVQIYLFLFEFGGLRMLGLQ